MLGRSRFRFQPPWARIISGADEGVFGWIALNYLSGAHCSVLTVQWVGVGSLKHMWASPAAAASAAAAKEEWVAALVPCQQTCPTHPNFAGAPSTN